jgi:uncharacterized protein YdhG (YjbR/CyaY superfamily)
MIKIAKEKQTANIGLPRKLNTERRPDKTTEMNEIETYIQQFPDSVQEILRNIRKLIKDNAPEAEELFAYGMPAYKTNKKPLVYFAAFKNHIGFYATPSGHSEFKDELSKYKQGKGSVQFPLDQPIPYKLIEGIVKFRVAENNERIKTK